MAFTAVWQMWSVPASYPRVPAEAAQFRAAQTVGDTQHQHRFQGSPPEQLQKALQLSRVQAVARCTSAWRVARLARRGLKQISPQANRVIQALVNIGVVLAHCVFGGEARFHLFAVIALEHGWGEVLELEAVEGLVPGNVAVKGEVVLFPGCFSFTL